MPIYVYQVLSDDSGGEPVYYEFRQRITDPPLTVHPETGEPVKRVLLGRFGVLTSGGRRDECGPGCSCG